MAQLTSEQRDELSAELQREWSRSRTPVPLDKARLRAAIDVFDVGMETAESAILSDVSAQAQAWLVTNQTLARYVLECVAHKRREVL